MLQIKGQLMKLLIRQIINLVKTLVVVNVIFLLGCSSIEYRSEAPKKNPLSPLTTVAVSVKKGWSASVGSGVGNSDVKLLLAGEQDTLVATDVKGNVVAIDRLTGKKRWQKHLKMPITSGPTIQNKAVVVGGNAIVIALNLSDGEILWKTAVTSEVLAAPKVQDDIVFINTLDGGLTALNANDGHQLWRFALSPPSLVLRRSSVPVVTKNRIIAGFANGKLVVINRLDGTVDWSADIAIPKGRSDIQRMVDISADLVVKDEVIYAVSYQGNLTAFALHTGQVIWEREVSSYAGLTVDNNKVYISATNGDVLAFDRHTGGSAWIQKSLHGRDLSKPVIQKNTIVVCDEDGYVHWLNRKQGQLVGRYKFAGKGGVEASPLVYDDELYIYGRNGQVGEIMVSFN